MSVSEYGPRSRSVGKLYKAQDRQQSLLDIGLDKVEKSPERMLKRITDKISFLEHS